MTTSKQAAKKNRITTRQQAPKKKRKPYTIRDEGSLTNGTIKRLASNIKQWTGSVYEHPIKRIEKTAYQQLNAEYKNRLEYIIDELLQVIVDGKGTAVGNQGNIKLSSKIVNEAIKNFT